MMNRFSLAQSISTLGLFTRDLIASAAGCFLFLPGFRLVTAGKNGSRTASSVHRADRSQERLAGVGAAFFLLSFIASEALATIRALGH
jgi:hypothetical protein